MSPWERRLQYIANALVGGSGLLYAAMRYLMTPADEWAVVNHPWQPAVQHAHVIVAPLLVFACGMIWRRHVAERWNSGRARRRSGPGMALLFVPMILSGYLLQTSVAEGWRQAWIVLHVLSSTLWLVAFAIHLRGIFSRRGADSSERPQHRARSNGPERERAARRPFLTPHRKAPMGRPAVAMVAEAEAPVSK